MVGSPKSERPQKTDLFHFLSIKHINGRKKLEKKLVAGELVKTLAEKIYAEET